MPYGSGSGRNINKAIASITSKAFARWLHHQYAPDELRSVEGGILFWCAIFFKFLKQSAWGRLVVGWQLDLGDDESVDVDNTPHSFVFASKNWMTTEDRLLVLIHGSGVVRAGQWARRYVLPTFFVSFAYFRIYFVVYWTNTPAVVVIMPSVADALVGWLVASVTLYVGVLSLIQNKNDLSYQHQTRYNLYSLAGPWHALIMWSTLPAWVCVSTWLLTFLVPPHVTENSHDKYWMFVFMWFGMVEMVRGTSLLGRDS